ncbi:MAG: hypothetical protein LBK94_05730 [Prevotellaceae bacterium]|nr:hypothetical protein [Prevotellaceae bacterium]
MSRKPRETSLRSEAIHKSLLINRITSVFDLVMTVKHAFDTGSYEDYVLSGRRNSDGWCVT